MDINRVDNIYRPKLSSSGRVDEDHGFKKIFDQKVSEINTVTAPSGHGYKVDILDRGHRILNLLDDFARDLNDPQRHLKDMGSLVKEIENEVKLIESGASDRVPKDQELDDLVRELAVTANVAVFKYHRGDYV